MNFMINRIDDDVQSAILVLGLFVVGVGESMMRVWAIFVCMCETEYDYDEKLRDCVHHWNQNPHFSVFIIIFGFLFVFWRSCFAFHLRPFFIEAFWYCLFELVVWYLEYSWFVWVGRSFVTWWKSFLVLIPYSTCGHLYECFWVKLFNWFSLFPIYFLIFLFTSIVFFITNFACFSRSTNCFFRLFLNVIR